MPIHVALRPYATAGTSYDEYGPAYQLGWESRARHSGQTFEQVESSMGTDWDRSKGKSKLKWDQARNAARDAWDRVDTDRQQE